MRGLPAETVDEWARDNAARALGKELRAVGSNAATLQLTNTPQHLSSDAMCHGGVIFTPADCAFA